MEDITKNAERKINDTAEKVHEGVEKARKAGTETLEKAYPNAEAAIEKAKAQGGALWEKAKNKGQDLMDDVEAGGEKILSQAKSFVQKRPVQVIGTAVLIGVALGFFLSQRNRD